MINNIDMKARLKDLFSLFGLLAIVLVSSLISDRFLRVSNIITILRQSSILLILSLGLTGVVLTGGIDLSISAIAAFVGCTVAQLLKSSMPISLVVLIGLTVGAVIGIFNGLLVGKLKMPPFVATYGMMMVVNGFSLIMMQGAIIYGLPESFTWFGVGYISFIPIPVILAFLVSVFFIILFRQTTFGTELYIIGSNETAAKYSSIPVDRRLITIYGISGLTAGFAGLILTARLDAAEVAMSEAFGLQTVAAVVIGGTSLLGGEGGAFGTVIGALVLTIVVNIMNIVGISSFVQPIVIGFVIITTVFIDVTIKKRK
jgi:ribose transport system permease protein